MIGQEREKNMLMFYMLQNITNGYLSLVHHDAEKVNPNKHLSNKLNDILKSTQKVFTPIDIELKKSGGFEQAFSMIQDYTDVIEKIKDMSHDQILKLKETEDFK
jgi:phosphomevalonate kinase